MNKSKGFSTKCVSDKYNEPKKILSHQPPIFATSTFVYESAAKSMEVFQGNAEAYIYGRWNNPNFELVEQKIAALETFGSTIEAKGLVFSSGMAAISAVLEANLKPNQKILTQGNLYGTTHEYMEKILRKNGIDILFEDFYDLDKLETVLKSDNSIQIIYIETPSNPTVDCYNLKKISNLAQQYNAKTIVDNTFATPFLQQPLVLGCDFLIHSTTKFLNGHGNAIGGIVVGKDLEFMSNNVWNERKLRGAVPSAFDVWLLNNGLKTLELRMERHCKNALAVAEFLEQHSAVSKVNYLGLKSHKAHNLAKEQMSNGFGGTLSFELKNGLDAGIQLMNTIEMLTLTASLGTTDTLIQHPASMTHVKVPKEIREQYGITDGLIRMSVGIENVEDIIADLEVGLK